MQTITSAGKTSGKQLMLKGLALAESKHKEPLAVAQLIAQFLGRQQPTVTADDVFLWIDAKALGSAAGAIFRGGDWVFVHWQESLRESNHGRPIRAWSLK